MDYDRLALLLLVHGSSRGFRKALKQSPTAALGKAGFNPGEVAQLVAALNKIKATKRLAWNDAFEQEEVKFTFQKIAVANVSGGTSATDDWDTC